MYKDDFPLLQTKANGSPILYLDNAATTQKPQVVIDAITNYYKNQNANIHRGVYKLSQVASQLYDDAHKIIAQFINAKDKEIILTSGMTESSNLLSYCIAPLLNGTEIVLTEMEHHANLVPWQQLAKRNNLTIKYIPVKEDFTLDYEAAEQLITENTALVAFSHMSNVLGVAVDAKRICALAKKNGAISIVDGAQSVAHSKVDVKDLDCDFFSFSAHKMCGPTGIGALYGKKELLEAMPPFLFGGDMIEKVSYEDSTWAPVPMKFEAGTPNIAGAVGFAKAIEYLSEVGMDNIHSIEKELVEYALPKLKEIAEVYVPSDHSGGIISFNLKGMHPHDVGALLDNEGICIRTGQHCAMPLMDKLGIPGTARVSFYFYNTKEDVDRFIDALERIKLLGE